MSFITSIGTANPPHKINQKQIAEFMIKAMGLNKQEAEQLRVLFRASGIESRFSVLEDYSHIGNFKFYPNSQNFEPFPSTSDRQKLFRQQSVQLSKQAALSCFDQAEELHPKDITHIIVVSCTGMFAPGLDIDLVHELGLSSTVQRTCINFMGCYAAFNAMRVADSFCSNDKNAKVLIVCTELCSIHFQKENTENNRLANALFADGSATVLVESNTRKGFGLDINNFYCDLAIEGEQEMAWTIGDLGFEMKLSAYVPEVIRKGIKKLTTSLLHINNLALQDISYFAIHPGGKKILETIECELGLTKLHNYFAYQIMRNYGNMSSPTVLFVLKEIISQLKNEDHDKKILSFGFGPGLTLESLVLTVNTKGR